MGAKLPEAAVKPIGVTAAHVLEKIAHWASEAVARDATEPSCGRAQLSLVSSLAEGADRIVAEAALRLNFSLTAILPFERSIYRHDFSTADSRAAFDTLLGGAESVVELDGRRGADAKAYAAAGIEMLAKADILIAIWNQKPADGEGGTAN